MSWCVGDMAKIPTLEELAIGITIDRIVHA